MQDRASVERQRTFAIGHAPTHQIHLAGTYVLYRYALVIGVDLRYEDGGGNCGIHGIMNGRTQQRRRGSDDENA